MADTITTKDAGKATSGCALCGSPKSPTGGSKWCNTCLDVRAKFLVGCLSQAGKLEQTEETITNLIDSRKNTVLQYYLGLVKASNGNLDGSIRLLMGLVGSGVENQDLGRKLAGILSSRAARYIKQRNYEEAVKDLSSSIEMDPGDAVVERSLAVARSISVILQTEKSSDNTALGKSIETLKQIQFQQPDNFIITHNLAVLSYRLASEAEEASKPSTADLAWRTTIANWASLLSSESFWNQWAERENSSYNLKSSTDDIKTLRKDISERLLQDFRTYRMGAVEKKDTRTAQRHHEYEVLFRLEVKTAAAMSKIMTDFRRDGINSPMPVSCGPSLMEALSLATKGREVVSAAKQHHFPENRVKDLEDCLSTAGRIGILIEINWFDQAEIELDDLLARYPSNKTLSKQMGVVMGKMAGQIAAEKFEAAVKKLEKGFQYAKDEPFLQETAVSIFIDEAKRIHDSGQTADVIDKVIKVLEKGKQLSPENGSLLQELATSYAERAVREGQREHWEAARKDIRSSLRTDKNNGRALQNVEIIYQNRIAEYIKAQQWTGAIDAINECLEFYDSEEFRQLLLLLKNRRGY
jgi:tetratricopeptide (TPR) repeat protein